MRLTILGNNGPFPAPGGACSGYLLTWGQGALQLDLGCGTLPRLTGMLPPEQLTAVILSHWHHDHCSDLLPLLYRMESLAAQGVKPLKVFGPADDASPVRQAALRSPGVQVTDVHPGDVLHLDGAEIAFAQARHPVPAVMMRIRAEGHTLCYTGDTNTCPALPSFAQGADTLLADGLFPERIWDERKPHLSAHRCAEIARDAGAKRLIITHLNPAIAPGTLLEEAQAAFPGAMLAPLGETLSLTEA